MSPADHSSSGEIRFPEALLRPLQAGDAVLWLGAGIGASVGRPGWEGLLRQLVQEKGEAARPMLHELLDQGRLHMVFTYLHRHHGDEPIAGYLHRLERSLPSEARLEDMLGDVRRLGQLPWAACLSTVYPDVARALFGGAPIFSHAEVQRLTLREASAPLLLRTPPTSRPMRLDAVLYDFIEELVHTRTIVFAGFDLDDPDFAQILDLLDRIGRGQNHFALMSLVSDAEAEALEERHAVRVVRMPDRIDWPKLSTNLRQQASETSVRPADRAGAFAALDLLRTVRPVHARADLSLDQAIVLDPSCIEKLLDDVPSLAAVHPAALLRAGNVMLAHGRLDRARKCFQHVASTVVGREFVQLARFDLGWTALAEGDRGAALEILARCAEADPSLALLPPRFSIKTLHGVLGTQLFLTAADRRASRDVDVLVTTMPRPVSGDERRRFSTDLERLRCVEHPALARALEGTAEGRSFGIVYERTPGFSFVESLGEHLAPGRILELLEPIGGALAACHAVGIIQGNLNPHRLLIGPAGPVLVGVGISPVAGWDRPSVRVHCRGYIAPEVLAGHAPQIASDVYSLTALLYRVLTGKPPSGSVPAPSTLNPDSDPRLDTVVRAGLHPNPSERPSVDALLDHLRHVLATPQLGRAQRAVVYKMTPGHEDVVDLGSPAVPSQVRRTPAPTSSRVIASQLEEEEIESILGRYAEQPALPELRIAAEHVEAVARQRGAWEHVARVLAVRAGGEEDPQRRVAYLRELAGLYERSLSNPAAAFEVLRALLAEEPAPDDLQQVRALRRLAAASGSWKSYTDELVALADRLEDIELRADVYAEAAYLLRTELAEPEAATACLRRIIELTEDGARLESLIGDLQELGYSSDAARACERLAQLQSGPSATQARLNAAALWIESDVRRAVAQLHAALAGESIDPEHLARADELARDAAERAPNERGVTRIHAQILARLEAWDELENVLRELDPASSRQSGRLWFALAHGRWQADDLAGALLATREGVGASTLDVADLELVYAVARRLLADGQSLDDTAKLLQGVVRHRPREPEALRMLHDVYERLQQPHGISAVGSVRRFIGDRGAPSPSTPRPDAEVPDVAAHSWFTWWSKVYHPDQHPIFSDLFALLWPAVAVRCGHRNNLPTMIVEPGATQGVTSLVGYLSRCFDAPKPDIVFARGPLARVDVFARKQGESMRVSPTLVFDERVLTLTGAKRHAAVGYAVGAGRPEHLVAALLPDLTQLQELVEAAGQACVAQRTNDPSPLVRDLSRLLSPSSKAEVATKIEQLRAADADLEQWFIGRAHTLCRLMFVSCNDIDATAELIEEVAADGPVAPAELLDDVLAFGVAGDALELVAGVA